MKIDLSFCVNQKNKVRSDFKTAWSLCSGLPDHFRSLVRMASLLLSRACGRSLTTFYLRTATRANVRLQSSSGASSSGVGTRGSSPNPTPSPAKRTSSSSPLTLDIDIVPEELAQSNMGRTGAKSSKNSLSSFEKRRRTMGRIILGAIGLGITFGIFNMGREWEGEEIRGRTKVSRYLEIWLLNDSSLLLGGTGRWSLGSNSSSVD
jgi:hypothetical protein